MCCIFLEDGFVQSVLKWQYYLITFGTYVLSFTIYMDMTLFNLEHHIHEEKYLKLDSILSQNLVVFFY